MSQVGSKRPDVAIIVPAYNAAGTLAETVESACVQNVSADVIIVDDGSLDETLKIARGFEPDVRVFTGPNRGVSAARNRGLANTTAPWIIFLDSDDVLLSGTVGKRLEIAHATNADIVICDWKELVEDAGGIKYGPCREIDWSSLDRDGYLAVASHIWATTAAVMYRRDLVERIGGFKGSLPVIQDARFLFDAIYAGGKVERADHVGALYRVLTESLSRRNPARFWIDVLNNGLEIQELWRFDGRLDRRHHVCLWHIYNQAARGLFKAGDENYFRAVEAQRALPLPPSRHSRIACSLARILGVERTRQVFSLLGHGKSSA